MKINKYNSNRDYKKLWGYLMPLIKEEEKLQHKFNVVCEEKYRQTYEGNSRILSYFHCIK